MSICSTEGCNNTAIKKGLCSSCYHKFRRHKKPGDEGYIKCSVDGCESHASYAGKYCERHYTQLRLYGKIFKTRFDKNEIEIHVDYAEILIEDMKTKDIESVKVSLSKLDLVSKYKWSIKDKNKEKFARTSDNIKLHRLICGISNDSTKRVIFKNRDTLDCRDENMIMCDIPDRVHRNKLSKNNKSGVKGVCFDNRSGKWRAYIAVNGKRIELGYDYDINKAIKFRKDGENLYWRKLPNE